MTRRGAALSPCKRCAIQSSPSRSPSPVVAHVACMCQSTCSTTAPRSVLQQVYTKPSAGLMRTVLRHCQGCAASAVHWQVHVRQWCRSTLTSVSASAVVSSLAVIASRRSFLFASTRMGTSARCSWPARKARCSQGQITTWAMLSDGSWTPPLDPHSDRRRTTVLRIAVDSAQAAHREGQ